MNFYEQCPFCANRFLNQCKTCGYEKKVKKKRKRSNSRGDIFYSPPHAIRSLLRREDFSGRTWEPAQGDGRIVSIMRERDHDVIGSDIADGTDFLKTIKAVRNIVTNPPWSIKDEWLAHAKRCAMEKIALLLEINFLTGVARFSDFQDCKFPLSAVYIFPRPLVFELPDGGKKPSMSFRHAWYVWERSHKGSPQIKWVPPSELNSKSFA